MTHEHFEAILRSPTSRCRAGVARVDVTPPVGIYHRMWGAAKHDRAEGVHRPLTATALILEPLDGRDGEHELFVAIDHCMIRPPDMEDVLRDTASRTGVPTERITFAFSHTHAGGHLCRARRDQPGGELLGPYLDALPERIAAAHHAAVETIRPVVVTYAHDAAFCDLGQNRDFQVQQPSAVSTKDSYVCGLNPHAIRSLPVSVARFCDTDGATIATIVNYPCHPTTLAWDNRLISPDYVGSLRETVEASTDAPCLFFLSPCGDIGPKFGFVGDASVADRNGRQLGYAALSALESLPPPGTDYHFVGPRISGATIGEWEHRPHAAARRQATSVFRGRRWNVRVPYRSDLPSAAGIRQSLDDFLRQESDARGHGDEAAAVAARALAERQRRLLERIEPLPPGDAYPFPLTVRQLGDAFWIGVEGEPYHALQQTLQDRFPRTPLVFVTLANGIRPSYVPTRAAYDKPLYQVEVALLAAGTLETLTEEIAAQISEWLSAG